MSNFSGIFPKNIFYSFFKTNKFSNLGILVTTLTNICNRSHGQIRYMECEITCPFISIILLT